MKRQWMFSGAVAVVFALLGHATPAQTTLPATQPTGNGYPPSLTAFSAAFSATQPAGIQPVQFSQETLPNGLRVLYVPLKDTPVVHVRVLYHVGSRDEKPDRQGFAHMFEHMMFRGSAHVAPEEHMKLIGIVGGQCNAFTSFDQTTYWETLPANQLPLALYLEADRMASFKVDDEKFKIERNVVAKEWGIRQNQPYGTQFEDFLAATFKAASYRWTPIGNMEQLRQAASSELQAFFNKYYLPNNAVLVISGDFDDAAAHAMVQKYFAWIPKGPEVQRDLAVEPQQTEAMVKEVKRFVPLPAVMIGYKLPSYDSNDYPALKILGTILGGSDSSRLNRDLVTNENPLCVDVGAGPYQLQDAGVFVVSGTVLQGKSEKDVQAALFDAVAKVIEHGVTPEEVAKAKLMSKKAIVSSRNTCDALATEVGEEALFGNDPNRANTETDRLLTVTAEDVQRVAAKYLGKNVSTSLITMPDPLSVASRSAAIKEQQKLTNAPVATTNAVVEPRKVEFPIGYPTAPPIATTAANPTFKKGEEFKLGSVKVIVMEDHRLPIVTWSLTMRRGGYAAPAGKEGVATLMDELMRHGVAHLTYDQLNQDLDERAIDIGVSDGGDFTRLSGSAITDELDYGITRSRDVLLSPTFPADEFDKLRTQEMNQLSVELQTPTEVATHAQAKAVYGDSPLGRWTTPQSLGAISLDDVKAFYKSVIHSNDAIFVIAGDVTVERGQALAKKLLDGLTEGALPEVVYAIPEYKGRQVILFDDPATKQSVIRLGIPAYDIHDDEKFAGMLAGQILSAGIESRLNKYVRAEKGYVYGVSAMFQPNRHGGQFAGETETGFETTVPTVEAMFKVFNDLRTSPVEAHELAEAKTRVAGAMLMETQTIDQQADRRVTAILNDYPIDYWDKLPSRVAEVTVEQVQQLMQRWVKDGDMSIVVVAPADKVKSQLDSLGKVDVKQMPGEKEATSAPANEMLK